MKTPKLTFCVILLLFQTSCGTITAANIKTQTTITSSLLLRTEPNFVEEYGEGYLESKEIAGVLIYKRNIFYIKDQDVWLSISYSHVLDMHLNRDVEEILVTKSPLCSEEYAPSKNFGKLTTKKGIRIGDEQQKILQAYGQPKYVIEYMEGKDEFSAIYDRLNIKYGTVFRYIEDEKLIEFYFIDGKLHSFFISIAD